MPPLRHAFITGGSRGIGLSIAHLLARHSFRCTLVARSETALSAAVASLPSSQPRHKYIVGDVSKQSFWTSPVLGDALPRPTQKQQRGQIDVLVNCAGVSQEKVFARTSAEELQSVVATNLTGLMMGTRFLLRQGYIQGGGKGEREAELEDWAGGPFSPVIINVASLLGLKGGYGAAAYAASKAGVLGFTRALATETGSQGLRVNAIVPGYINTDMTSTGAIDRKSLLQKIPLQRFGNPEEIASAALFLTQNQYAHNCVINLDGGLSAV
ncbi:hypothetical protein BDV95DRAFT_608441 [Massariosphaeria phaeospora]|uniref:3-oxoacyl-reductase n=1 Tax=Massariosphaeria phaeospora TaxID=100035 RepID=A0A7C8I334_9PLEO|nr:hypothetical protein BDV95DRAFT_608441 [Massariosphaeria phaeospora]